MIDLLQSDNIFYSFYNISENSDIAELLMESQQRLLHKQYTVEKSINLICLLVMDKKFNKISDVNSIVRTKSVI